jgi:nucleoside-diphosphate kinase
MENTLLLIKPNATENNVTGRILSMVEENNLTIQKLRMFTFTDEIAQNFYAEHVGREFYEPLMEFMKSGKTVGVVLSGENAVKNLRALLGTTNPEEALPGTVRYLFGENTRRNACHGSDSEESAKREISLIFPEFVFSNKNKDGLSWFKRFTKLSGE